MKYLSLSKSLAFLSVGVLLFSSCDKGEQIDPIGDGGQTIVKIVDPSGEGKIGINIGVVTTPQVLNMVDVRRDVPNEAQLNRTMTVIVEDAPGAVSDYNAQHGSNFEAIPAGQYTIDPANPKVGNNYTVTFNPGEFAKPIKFTIPNATLLDLNKQYAFGFRLKSADADGKISAEFKTIVVEVGPINKWDGVYRVTGSMVDVANATFVGSYPLTFHLITTGANTCDAYDPDYGIYGHVFDAAGTPNYYGSFMPALTFDPTTNVITSATNYWGQNSGVNVRSCRLDPTGVNAVDGSKNIRIKYILSQAPPPPGFNGDRVFFNETWTYVGPR
jgi:Domain of unknown function (DUF1735)